MGAFWNFIEKTLIQSTLAEKYQNLIAKSLISNPVAAEDAFTSRTEQSDVLLAAIPYSSISDSTITVSNSEITFKQINNTMEYEAGALASTLSL